MQCAPESYVKFQAEPQPIERLVTGRDLIARGLEPGPVFSEILEEIYDAQLEGKFIDRKTGLRFLDEFLSTRN